MPAASERIWTFSQRANIGECGVSAVAGQYPVAQLFNPVGSGKLVVLSMLGTTAGALATVQVAYGATQAASLDGLWVGKYLGTAGLAQLRYQNAVSQLAYHRYIGVIGNQSNDYKEIYFPEPIIIPEGFGVHVTTSTNIGLWATFQGYEVT